VSAPSTAQVGTRVVHRRYVPYSHAHSAGNLVDGAYSLGLFGDVATEMCILTDGDEGLFASYSDVQFKQPVRAGDVLEIVCEITRVGTQYVVRDVGSLNGTYLNRERIDEAPLVNGDELQVGKFKLVFLQGGTDS